jgi:hypothetical protein
MNTLAAASFVLAALATTFTTPVAAAAALPSDHAVLVVSCGPGNRPSQRAVAELLGTNNAQEIYAGRNRLMAQVRSACRKAGTERVAVVGRESSTIVAVEPAAPVSKPIADN